jgi:hypothetical protein
MCPIIRIVLQPLKERALWSLFTFDDDCFASLEPVVTFFSDGALGKSQ